MKELAFENARKINAHYAPAVVSDNGKTIYVSGQLPIDPVTRSMCKGDIKEQTRMALGNVEQILRQAGADRTNILRTTAYVDSIENWEAVNAVYTEFFGDNKPARTIVNVPNIHFGLGVEIEAIAEL